MQRHNSIDDTYNDSIAIQQWFVMHMGENVTILILRTKIIWIIIVLLANYYYVDLEHRRAKLVIFKNYFLYTRRY